MKRYAFVFVVICIVAWTFGGQEATLAAQDESAPGGIAVTVTGLNYCVEVELKLVDEADAEAAMDKYRHALKVDEIKDADGKSLDDAKGWTLFYLYSDEALPLLTDKNLHNKKVSVEGTLYKEERALVVTSVAESIESARDAVMDFLLSGELADISVTEE